MSARRKRANAVPEALVSSADVRAIARLLGRVLSLRASDDRKRAALMEGVASLVGADVWVWVVQKGNAKAGDLTYYTMLDGGFESERQKSIALGAAWSTDNPFVENRWFTSPDFTVLRSEVFDDAAWYASDLYRRHREPAGLDDFLFAGFWVSPEILSGVGLHRRPGRPRFGERERKLVRIVMSEVEWLHRAGLPAEGFPPVELLTPRQRHVMLLLLAGNSRKVIAHAIDVSLHTVNEHVAAIYAQFGVHSRAELMAKFVRGR